MSSGSNYTNNHDIRILWNTETIGDWAKTLKRAPRMFLAQTIEFAHICTSIWVLSEAWANL